MKKIILLILSVTLICSSFIVCASGSFYYDDFSGYAEGEKPNGFTISASGNSKVYVSKTQTDGKTKNVLKLEHNSSIISISKPVGNSSYITASMRFKRVGEGKTSFPSIVLVARRKEKEVFRIYANSKDNRVVINSSLSTTPLFLPSNPKEIYIEDDVWNTFSIYVNTVTHKAGFKIETDTLKGLKLVDNVNIKYDTKNGIAAGDSIDIDKSFDCIDDIRVFTGGTYTGAFEIDYIDIDNKDNPFKLIKEKPAPLTLPLTATAEERLVPDRKNVVVDNAVCYYPEYPFSNGEKWFAEYKKTFEALGYYASYSEDIITAYNDKSQITLDYKNGNMNVDGKDYNISPAIFNEDYIMIPITELSEVLGFYTRISDKAVYISKDELFGLEISPYIFKGKLGIDGDDNTYIFHFGKRDNKFEDVGIEINGGKYPAKNFDGETGTKFGIGIADPNNKLGDTYIVKPYFGNKYKDVIRIDKNAE